MDGRVKSRGRRSLVKRHRGSRLSVPVPVARRQRVELPLGSMFDAADGRTGWLRWTVIASRVRVPEHGPTWDARACQRLRHHHAQAAGLDT